MNSLSPKTYESALEKAQNRSKRPRKSLRPSKQGLARLAIDRERQPQGNVAQGNGNLQGRIARAKRAKKKRARLPTIKNLKARIWKEFSIYIRTKDADEFGRVSCVTCDARHLWNSGQVHAGHWIHGRLDFEEKNVHPQCKNDNYFTNTRVQTAYACFMAKTYGAEVMDELRLLSNTKGNNYSRAELDDLLEHYRTLNANNPLLKTSDA